MRSLYFQALLCNIFLKLRYNFYLLIHGQIFSIKCCADQGKRITLLEGETRRGFLKTYEGVLESMNHYKGQGV